MSLSRNRLYLLISGACFAGYAWLFIAARLLNSREEGFEPCLIKNVTGIPCPSCGSTRSVLNLAAGDVAGALLANPMGLLVAAIMIAGPLWIMYDLVTGRETLFLLYRKIERWLRKPGLYIPLIVIVLINWIWNIIKGV